MSSYLLPGSAVSATPASSTLYELSIIGLPLLGHDKVREDYTAGDDKLLMVTTDRLSALDVTLDQLIPDKGRILAQVSDSWFNKLHHIVPTRETGIAPKTVVASDEIDRVRNRAIMIKRLKPVLMGAVVRGYLAGSGWKDYQATGVVCGVYLAPGLQNVQKLPEPIFTPTAKAGMGEHDENISFDEVEHRIGPDFVAQIRDVSIRLYREAFDFAATRSIIIADTGFEFGLDENGTLTLMGEAFTADSSRFWPADLYRVDTSPLSFDKQFVHNWLEVMRIDSKSWPKIVLAPQPPADAIEKTASKHREALAHLTGESPC